MIHLYLSLSSITITETSPREASTNAFTVMRKKIDGLENHCSCRSCDYSSTCSFVIRLGRPIIRCVTCDRFHHLSVSNCCCETLPPLWRSTSFACKTSSKPSKRQANLLATATSAHWLSLIRNLPWPHHLKLETFCSDDIYARSRQGTTGGVLLHDFVVHVGIGRNQKYP